MFGRRYFNRLLYTVLVIVIVLTISNRHFGTVLLSSSGVTGQVCSLGIPPFDEKDIISELGAFQQVFTKQRKLFQSARNKGGNGLFHSFGLWFLLRRLNPPLMVESGVHKGQTSWLMRQACPHAKFIRIDPSEKLAWQETASELMLEFRGKAFVDFDNIPWSAHTTSQERANAVVFFDDHIDHMQRLRQAKTHGFAHLVFDDNYMPGVGDCFSIKDACDGSKGVGVSRGRVRRVFSERPKRCTIFHRECAPLSDEEAVVEQTQLSTMAEVVWEFPPLSPLNEPLPWLMWLSPFSLSRPYGAVRQHGHYELPTQWNSTHSQLFLDSTKPPLLTTADAAGRFGQEVVDREVAYYINLVYVKLTR